PAALLHQLRELMRSGDDDVFMTAIRTYVQEWAYKHPTPYDLFRTMERFAGRDLDWYWQPWYFEVRKLDHAVASVETEGDELVVTIEDRGFIPHPCTVEARYAEGRSERQVIGVDTWLGGAMRHVLRFPAGARTVLIDPDRDTLDIEPDNNVWQAEGR
ncbi:MAG: M1 family peptidase, partial [Planctomycetota bacterium]